MIKSTPKVSFDTNILIKLSVKDWIFWVYKKYKPIGESKEQIFKIFLLGMSKINLVISETAFREFFVKCARDEVVEVLKLMFDILPQEENSLAVINELSTSLAKLYSRYREEGDPEPGENDIKIFLESWKARCNYLLTDDGFFESFQRFLQKEISDINSSTCTEEKEGRIQHLAKYVLNEEQIDRIIPFLENLLMYPLPKISQTEIFLEEWRVEESDYDKLIEKLSSIQEVILPTVTEEVRRAVVQIHDTQDKILFLDELLGKIAPDFFGKELIPPPYGEELNKIFTQTQKFLAEIGIKSITVDIGLPLYLIEIFSTGEIMANFEGSYFDFDYDTSLMWVYNQYGEPEIETQTEIDLETLIHLIKEIEEKLRIESARKAMEWKSYWTSRFGSG